VSVALAARSSSSRRSTASASAFVEQIRRLLPTEELQFLMELSIEPVDAQLGILEAA
jgi:adenine C2-methylase RlmN of 23S rRNA A2503 and tRNA A37